jgi:uroporphyrinogen decarboxylase
MRDMRSCGQLSSRERVLLALRHEQVDRIPIAMVCSGINEPARGEFGAFLRQKCGLDLAGYLDSMLDIRSIAPKYVGPSLETGEDFWGVKRKAIHQSGGGSYEEIDYYPLATAEGLDALQVYNWPHGEWFDYSTIPEQIDRINASGEPYAIMALNCNIFETSWYLRGFEQAFMDLALETELFASILQSVTDFYYEHARRTLEAARGRIDLVFTADDIGQQNGLLMSLEMWEKHIKPHHARINRLIHEHGVRVIYHTDGAIVEAVPGLIDMGIDVLQALQFDAAGMDARILKEQYGDRLCFEGGVSVQKTLPFGKPDDVREEVEELISVLGRDGGYILGPAHAIQAGTPVENIFALFETALHYRHGS